MKKAPTLLLAVGLLSLAPYCLAENLLRNPGFEQERANWKTYIPGDEPLEWVLDESDPHSGSVAAVMKSTIPERWAVMNMKAVDVIEGHKYRVEAWVRCAPGTKMEPDLPGVYVGVAFFSGDWEELCKQPPYTRSFFGLADGVVDWEGRKFLQPEKLPDKWTKASAVFEAPPSAAYMSMALTLHGTEGDVFWDDISVEEVDAATPVTDALK